MIDTLRLVIRRRWNELGLPGPRPPAVSFHLSGDGGGDGGRAIVRVFRPHETRPILLAKIPRDGAARTLALREHDLLRELEETAPRLAGRRFPRAVLLETHDGQVITVQTVIAGRPLHRTLRGTPGSVDTARALYGEAREWLGEFWRGTGLLEGTGAALWEPFLRAAHFHRHAHPEDAERSEVEALLRELGALREEISLCGYGHGELSAGNLVGPVGNTGAVDWEHARKRQLPWVDPLSFALDLALRAGEANGAGRRAGFEAAFLRDGDLRDVTARFLDVCFTEGGVRPEILPVALPCLVLLRAQRAARLHGPDHPSAVAWREIARAALRERPGIPATA